MKRRQEPCETYRVKFEGATLALGILRSRGAKIEAMTESPSVVMATAWNFQFGAENATLVNLACLDCIFNIALYAHLRNIPLFVQDSSRSDLEGRSIYYVKILLIRRLLKAYSTVMWMNSDAFVKDYNLLITDFFSPRLYTAYSDLIAQNPQVLHAVQIVVQQDPWLNTGVMIFRRGKWTDMVLTRAWDDGHLFQRHPAEQVALQHAIQHAFQVYSNSFPYNDACIHRKLKDNECWRSAKSADIRLYHCHRAFYCIGRRSPRLQDFKTVPFLLGVDNGPSQATLLQVS
ncbi:unnamed protein product [Vitrella brassicaformis CCMP3155]|uniref:Nucleotide-diphospho-sugar transferase domain-containing protein n=1 Tax=Vitrella brassicaformis (strain CCMP3155) TaxID=1169540 RepID=A0A0G4FDE6_VITBC|nr:unnamed protein product [Vitrella brassicaformis CCMP3155]|eukprot:CEM11223.1 unnamed protein product [Vitrella brassicaformis CCMP3155]